MSKEQTPIKDLDYYKSNAEEEYIKTPISVLRYISELESNTQAKVLEALEREFKKVAFMLPDGIPLKGDINYITGEQHYETEVKPKYNLAR
jgi:hypothetical protein